LITLLRMLAVRTLRSGGDFFIDAEVLFDCGDASKRVIDFIAEAGHIVEFFLEVVEVATNRSEFRVNRRKFFADDLAHLVFGRHVFAEVGDVLGTSALGGRICSLPWWWCWRRMGEWQLK
jgi:hypothetical protein